MENQDSTNRRKREFDRHNKDRIGFYEKTIKKNEKSVSYRDMEQLCQRLRSILN
jgi:hypothetical protein